MKKLHNIIFVLAIAFVFISCVDEDAETCNELELRFLEEPPNHSECNFVRNNCSAFPQISDFCMTANHLPNPDGNGDGGVDPDDNEDPAPTTCTGDEIRNVSCGLNSRGFQKQVCVDGIFINHPLEPCGDPDVCVDGTKEEDDSCEDGDEIGTKTRTCEDGKWSDFGVCHICSEGKIDTLGCESHLANPYRVCNSENSYDECKIDDYDDIDNIIFYKENGASHGNTFTTDVNGISSISISIWFKQTDENRDSSGTVVAIRIHDMAGSTINNITLSAGSVRIYRSDDDGEFEHFNFPMWVKCETEPYFPHDLEDCGSDPRTSDFNLLTITIAPDEFKFYYNGEYVKDISEKDGNSPVFQFPGLEGNETFEIRQTHKWATYSHTTIIDGILSPEDVALLYEKGPASP